MNAICNSCIKTVEQQAMLGLPKVYLWLEPVYRKHEILMAAKTHDTYMILSIKVLFTLKLFSSYLERYHEV